MLLLSPTLASIFILASVAIAMILTDPKVKAEFSNVEFVSRPLSKSKLPPPWVQTSEDTFTYQKDNLRLTMKRVDEGWLVDYEMLVGFKDLDPQEVD